MSNNTPHVVGGGLRTLARADWEQRNRAEVQRRQRVHRAAIEAMHRAAQPA